MVHRLAVALLLAAGCGGSGSEGDNLGGDPDASPGTPDAASPDAAPEVPFEDRSWGDVEILGPGEFPQVAIAANGDVMTMWSWDAQPSYETRCFVRRRAFASSSWEPEHDLATPEEVSDSLAKPEGSTIVQRRDFCTSPQNGLGLDESGRAVAIFIHDRTTELDTGGGDRWWSGMRATYDPASGWSEAEWFGQNSSSGSATYGVAMAGSGNGLLGWEQPSQVVEDDNRLWAADYQVDGGWQDPLIVEETPDGVSLDKLAVDDQGDGLALIRVESQWMAARREGGSWQAPVPVVDDDYSVGSQRIAMNGDGVAILIWQRCDDGGACQIRARRFDPGTGWQAPATIVEEDSGLLREQRVAIDSAGNGLVVWLTWPDRAPGAPGAQLWAARFGDGGWTEPELVEATPRNVGMTTARVALGEAGNGLIAWSYASDYDDEWECMTHQEFRARTYTPDSGFGPATTLEAVDGAESSCPHLASLALAMNAAGVGVAVWSSDEVGRARMFR